MLNPDGVKRGFYRSDIYGVNLNRTYQNPDLFRQPSIFAVKTLMMYHHFNRTDPKLGINTDLKTSLSCENANCQRKGELLRESKTDSFLPGGCISTGEIFSSCETINDLEDGKEIEEKPITANDCRNNTSSKTCANNSGNSNKQITGTMENDPDHVGDECQKYGNEGGIYVYIDLHGHASKRGCFIYGNNFLKEKDMVECMLFPKLISLNSSHFDFLACNFTKKNMYHKDKKDGLSKEGSGRVSMFKELGIIHR